MNSSLNWETLPIFIHKINQNSKSRLTKPRINNKTRREQSIPEILKSFKGIQTRQNNLQLNRGCTTGYVHSCIFSMSSSLYLPFSFPTCRDLAFRSRIFFRSLSSFNLVITTYLEKTNRSLFFKWKGFITKIILYRRVSLDKHSLGSFCSPTSCPLIPENLGDV